MSGFGIEKHGASGFFRRFGLGFVGFAAVLLLVVMYMALSRATIIIEPKEEVVNADLLVTVRETGLRSGDILGKIDKVTVSREAVFTASSTGQEAPAKAMGDIVIYNESSRSQTLIATTRFLSKDGVLFRLKTAATVPAGKNIKAQIYADKEGKSGEIGPTAFTIPGLAKDLQKIIYAKSASATTGGTKTVSIITQADIDDAVENLRATLVNEAAGKLKALLTDATLIGLSYTDSVAIKEADVKAGDAADSFNVKVELDVVGVSYDSSLQNQAAKTLANMVSADRELVSSNILEIEPVIEKYDLTDKTANLKIGLSGSTVIGADSAILSKEKMAGMREADIKEYLEKYAGVESVEIKYFPFKTDRVPKLRDHIKVVIK